MRRYAAAGKVHVRKMLSVTLTFEPMALHVLSYHVDLATNECLISVMKIRPCVPEIGAKMPSKVLDHVCDLLSFDLKIQSFHLCPQVHRFVNLVKFPQTVC